jgi:hypothetical protein
MITLSLPPLRGLSQNVGVLCWLPDNVISRLLATSRCEKPACCARVRS